ncbi:MAG: hypothetical protein HYZ29_35615 [Myxococcales bacterium]|nr:hypothetical protein [Myxococcales bacterium]
MAFAIPEPKHVSEMMSSLFAMPTSAKKASAPYKPGPKETAFYSAFAAESPEVGAVIVTDLSFACRAGAALALIPVGVAEEGIKAHGPSGELMDNYREVMNVASTLLANPTTRARLLDVRPAPGELPDGSCAIVEKPSRRIDFDVDLGKYGKGRLALLYR